MTEDDGVFGAGDDGWRKEDEGAENSEMGGAIWCKWKN